MLEVEEKDVVLGMRSPKNRSLLGVNEDFEGEHNDKIHFLFSLIARLCATKKVCDNKSQTKVEVAGVEPASKQGTPELSTRLADHFVLLLAPGRWQPNTRPSL